MSRHPVEPLSAEERAVAARLPRLHVRTEPDAALDARILGAARAAVAPVPAVRRRNRWMAPLAVAASLSLAVGLAWRLQPLPDPGVEAVTPVAATAEAGVLEVPGPVAETIPEQRPATVDPAPLSSQAGQEGAHASADVTAPAAAQQPSPAAPPPPPAAPAVSAPVAAVENSAAADMATVPIPAPASMPPVAKTTQSTEATRERQAAAASAAPRSQANEAAVAADAAGRVPQAFIGDDPGEEVPPATVDSPEVRSAWLRRIGELLQQGRTEDARTSLAEFRRRHPDAPLPAELRTLEP